MYGRTVVVIAVLGVLRKGIAFFFSKELVFHMTTFPTPRLKLVCFVLMEDGKQLVIILG